MTGGFDAASATLDALLREYAEAAVSHRAASGEGKHKVANRAYERIAAVVRELRSRGPDAHATLLRLLDDVRTEVRGWAAAHALELDRERAEGALELIARGPPSLEEFSAKMVLQQWRAGTLKLP